MKKIIQLVTSIMLVLVLCACGSKTDNPTIVVTGGSDEEEVTDIPIEILDIELYEKYEKDLLYNYHLKVKNVSDDIAEGFIYFQILDKDGMILNDSAVKVLELEAGQAAMCNFQLNNQNGYKFEDVYSLNFNYWQPVIDGAVKPKIKMSNPFKVNLSDIPENQ